MNKELDLKSFENRLAENRWFDNEALKNAQAENKRKGQESSTLKARIASQMTPLLKSELAKSRAVTVHALGKWQIDSVIDDLVLLLQDSDLDVAIAAVEALGEFDSCESVPELVEKKIVEGLWQAYCRHPSSEVKRAVVSSLCNINSVDGVRYLAYCFDDPKDEVYWADNDNSYMSWLGIQDLVIEGLRTTISRWGDESEGKDESLNIACAVIARAIEQSDAQDLSASGLPALASMGVPGLVLVYGFFDHENSIVRRRAINVLAKPDSISLVIENIPGSLERFQSLLLESNNSISAAAARALASAGKLAESVEFTHDAGSWSRHSDVVQSGLIDEFAQYNNDLLQTILVDYIEESDLALKSSVVGKLALISSTEVMQYFLGVSQQMERYREAGSEGKNFVLQVLTALTRAAEPLQEISKKILTHILQDSQAHHIYRSAALSGLGRLYVAGDLPTQTALTAVISGKVTAEINLRCQALTCLCRIDPQCGVDIGAEILGELLQKEADRSNIIASSKAPSQAEISSQPDLSSESDAGIQAEASSENPVSSISQVPSINSVSSVTQLPVSSTLAALQCPSVSDNSTEAKSDNAQPAAPALTSSESQHLHRAEQRQSRNYQLINPESLSHEMTMGLTSIEQIASAAAMPEVPHDIERRETLLALSLAHRDPQLQLAAIKGFAQLYEGGVDNQNQLTQKAVTVASLLPLMTDEDFDKVFNVVRTLSVIDLDCLFDHCDSLLERGSVGLLQVLCDAIVLNGAMKFLPLLLKHCLRSSDSAFQRSIVEVLLVLTGPKYLNQIVELALNGNEQNGITIVGLMEKYLSKDLMLLVTNQLIHALSNESGGDASGKQYLITTLLTEISKVELTLAS
ncbi:MAG: hypothetical protein COA42_11110 [Alteromonadaceae bacterium]|nr:MAG: hypothetical protein COA42_11110 [Alteromonadaceae bacterium]